MQLLASCGTAGCRSIDSPPPGESLADSPSESLFLSDHTLKSACRTGQGLFWSPSCKGDCGNHDARGRTDKRVNPRADARRRSPVDVSTCEGQRVHLHSRSKPSFISPRRPSRAARAAQLRVLEPNASSVRLELRLVPCQVQRHPSAPQPPTARCQRLADTSKRPFQLCHSRSAILRQRSLFMRYQRVRPTVGPLPPVF